MTDRTEAQTSAETKFDLISAFSKFTPAFLRFLPVILPLYGLVVAFIYLRVYWDGFDVDILQYVQLSELPKFAASALFPLFAAPAIAPLMYDHRKPGRRATLSDRILVHVLLAFVSISIVYRRPSFFLFVLCSFVGLGLLLWIARLMVERFELKRKSRALLCLLIFLYAVLFVPIGAIGIALTQIWQVKLGTEDKIVSLTLANDSELSGMRGEVLHHIGHVGDTDFYFCPRTEAVFVVPTSRVIETKIHNRDLCFRCYSVAGGEIAKFPPPWPFN